MPWACLRPSLSPDLTHSTRSPLLRSPRPSMRSGRMPSRLCKKKDPDCGSRVCSCLTRPRRPLRLTWTAGMPERSTGMSLKGGPTCLSDINRPRRQRGMVSCPLERRGRALTGYRVHRLYPSHGRCHCLSVRESARRSPRSGRHGRDDRGSRRPHVPPQVP